jgi:tetratricopeptide (TPR) repeat protein
MSELRHALTLILASAGVGLFIVLAIGLVLTSIRVGVLGRVLVLPFRGTDERRGELAALFATRLIGIEREWTTAARKLIELKETFHEETSRAESGHDAKHVATNGVAPNVDQADRHPLAAGQTVEHTPVPQQSRDLAAGPRTTGDDFLADILLLDEDSSLAGADLGTVSVAGVSFSPQHVLAFMRRLPGMFARRILSGSLLTVGNRAILTVTYAERSLRRRANITRRVAEFGDDAWLSSVDNIAFEIAKARIERLRERRKASRKREPEGTATPVTASGSYSADRALVEAQTWEASKAFLDAYACHLQHYVSGRASDRDEAVRRYDEALTIQPSYTRAAYNRATLAYNRYLPAANQQAMADFERATASDDVRVRALAWAGLAMAYCQAIHRFNADPQPLAAEALDASERAIELDPDLEETRFSRGWAHQTQHDWNEALDDYESVVETPAEETAPGRRIKSFALNNAGWIWLEPLHRRTDAILKAEQLLWRAVDYYPNKIGYANLAEVARRYQRYDDALAFFDRALELDDCYVNAWNERAQLEIEIAAAALAKHQPKRCKLFIGEAVTHHARAKRVAEDDDYIKQLEHRFQTSVQKHARALGKLAEALTPESDKAERHHSAR